MNQLLSVVAGVDYDGRNGNISIPATMLLARLVKLQTLE